MRAPTVLQRRPLHGRADMPILSTPSDVHGKRKIEITIPQVPSLAQVPSNYKVDIRNPNAANMYVLDELAKPEVVGSEKLDDGEVSTPPRPEASGSRAGSTKGGGPGRRRAKVARRPRITGTVAHECVIQPVNDDSYRAVMRARQQKAAKPTRTIKQLDTDIGTANRMASGVATGYQATKFAALTVCPNHPYNCLSLEADSLASQRNKVGPPKGKVEKFARMPRTALLDLLFDGFTRYSYWSTKALRSVSPLDFSFRVRRR